MKCRRSFPVISLTVFFVLFSSCSSPVTTQSPTLTPSFIPPPAPTDIPKTGTPTPWPTPLRTSVKIIGEEEMVYDWSADQCAPKELPDLPVRAFRDAEGMIQINLSFTTNFRMLGKDFDSLKTDCNVTLTSDMDIDPSHFSYSEWMGSTYTLDGKTIYALIHNEFYGHEASRWHARRDFGADQGGNDWHYQSWIGSSYRDMTFDAGHDRWQGARSLCQIGPNWTHPDLGCEPTRTWVSPVDATVTVSGSARDLDPSGGNGVIVTIHKGNEQLWSATIPNGDNKDYKFSLQVSVRVGDTIHFRVNANGDSNWDSTYFNPEINLGPDPCVSGIRDDCIMMSITYAVSTDGGRTFTQPPAPDHLVATMPYIYKPNIGEIGVWQPSNIVKNPKDGFYYVLMELDYHPAGRSWNQGMCVMRTQTLDDPKSWRAWDGKGFNLQFVNPYQETITDPAKYTCQTVSQNIVGALSYSLTYNSFFGKFIAVGQGVNETPPGFYYSLSDDLIHWTPKKLLMRADSGWNVNWNPPFFAYPSLIDPDSPSRNFDVTGQTPYLYFTRFNRMDPFDFDLVRARIQFSK